MLLSYKTVDWFAMDKMNKQPVDNLHRASTLKTRIRQRMQEVQEGKLSSL